MGSTRPSFQWVCGGLSLGMKFIHAHYLFLHKAKVKNILHCTKKFSTGTSNWLNDYKL